MKKKSKWLGVFLFALLILGRGLVSAQSNSSNLNGYVTNGTVNSVITDGTTTYVGGNFSSISVLTGGVTEQ